MSDTDQVEEPSSPWKPGADDLIEKRGDKPPKTGKGREGKKPKDQRADPDFEDVPGYQGAGFKESMDLRPPAPPQAPQGDRPPMIFTDTGNLSEDDCKKALQKHVNDQLCFGKKPVEEMQIMSVKGVTALHYKLETFSEKRKTKKKKVPYKGGLVDGSKNGVPPQPWEISCPPKHEFKDDLIKKEVPHTAKVKKCKDCHGKGWETCDTCDGWGKVECDKCNGSATVISTDADGNETAVPCVSCAGSGQISCVHCGGDGRVTCDDCDGYKKLKCYIQLKVNFFNHQDDYILETTDMPDALVANVSGIVLFQQELPMVWPIINFPVPEINQNSQRLVETHYTKWSNEFIHKQRQTLRGVPVTEVHYKWKDFQSRYWVYGTERKVYAPDYPQQCCFGCSIV